MFILALFKKKQSEGKSSEVEDILGNARNWYAGRYTSAVVQRNFLLILTFVAFGAVAVSIFTISEINRSRTIEPFVVEIEKKSGITTLVDPITVKQYSADNVINNYFIVEYVKTRELFDPNNFSYNFYTKLRLFSAQAVYEEFKAWINLSNPNSPFNLYKGISRGNIKIRSMQNLHSGTVQVRFTLEFQKGFQNIVKDRIAVVSFDYISMEMNEEQRHINPLGFRITYYRADDEFL